MSRWLALTALAFATGCSGLDEGDTIAIELRVVSPANTNIEVGQQEQLSAQAFNSNGEAVAEFTVNADGRTPKPESDIEAVFLTPAGIDKFMIPYLTRVFGVEYAAARRREWIRE